MDYPSEFIQFFSILPLTDEKLLHFPKDFYLYDEVNT
jgi:hypothetical protein